MISFVYKLHEKMIKGILVSDNSEILKYNVPTGAKFWNLENMKLEDITEDNYSGIGVSDLHLKVAEDEENN